ncbi:ATP-binding cassette protein subfamily C, member 2, putative, partial [Leishmania donovani]
MQYEDPRHHSAASAERRALPKGGHQNGAAEQLATASKATAANRQAALHERDTLKQRITELWGPPKHYVECDEDRASFSHRMWYFFVYPMVLLASREQISLENMPPPTRDVRAHDCGLRLSRAVQAAMYERNAWNCMVGTEVVSTLDASSRGVLRWVGVPQQGGYTRMMAGVEWSVPPALRTAARSDDSG